MATSTNVLKDPTSTKAAQVIQEKAKLALKKAVSALGPSSPHEGEGVRIPGWNFFNHLLMNEWMYGYMNEQLQDRKLNCCGRATLSSHPSVLLTVIAKRGDTPGQAVTAKTWTYGGTRNMHSLY